MKPTIEYVNRNDCNNPYIYFFGTGNYIPHFPQPEKGFLAWHSYNWQLIRLHTISAISAVAATLLLGLPLPIGIAVGLCAKILAGTMPSLAVTMINMRQLTQSLSAHELN